MYTAKLKSLIVGRGETQQELAEAIGMGQSALNDRINGKISFRQDEMLAIKLHYNLTAEELDYIFFTP